MEIEFREETIDFLQEKIVDGLYQEQTAEMTVPEELPAINRIVDCFGTVLVQSRSVSDGCVSVSGGIQAGVLYVPEGADGPERIDVYIPFTVSKKMPTRENTTLFYWGWLKSIDARFINPRKVLVRANLGSELSLFTPAQLALKQVENCPAWLQCKERVCSMQLPVFAGEKEIQIADEVLMPEQEIGADRILKWTCSAEVDESSVVGDKAVFKGKLRIKALYRSEDGRLAVWNGAVPYSQYLERGKHAEDGFVTVQPVFRTAELDTDGQIDSRRLLLNMSVTAQVLVRGAIPVTLTEDVYCLGGEFEAQWQALDLKPCLDLVSQSCEQSLPIPEEAVKVLDWTVTEDQSAAAATAPQECALRLSGSVMYYDKDETIRSKPLRLEKTVTVPDGENADWACVWRQTGPMTLAGRELKLPLRTDYVYYQKPGIKNLAGGVFTPVRRAEGPTLIVKKAEGELWELAKQCGSTVEALRQANGLEDDQIREQRLLLIPTGRAVYADGEDEA